jgi:anti-sigma regulatory factor (Ser/Thr protein kinase)
MTADRPPGGGQPDTATPPTGTRALRGPFSAAGVRRLVRETIAADPSPCDARALGDAVLAASELAANAIVHGGGITRCEARLVPLGVEISVDDLSSALPRLTEQPPLTEAPSVGGGFGWRLIQQLALRVTITRHDLGPEGTPRGKRITLVLPLY